MTERRGDIIMIVRISCPEVRDSMASCFSDLSRHGPRFLRLLGLVWKEGSASQWCLLLLFTRRKGARLYWYPFRLSASASISAQGLVCSQAFANGPIDVNCNAARMGAHLLRGGLSSYARTAGWDRS